MQQNKKISNYYLKKKQMILVLNKWSEMIQVIKILNILIYIFMRE